MNNLELVYPSPRERKTSFDTQRSNEFSSTPSQFGGCLEKVCHVQRSIENIAHFSLGLDQRSACDTSIKKSGFAPNQSWGLHIVLKENKTKTESEGFCIQSWIMKCQSNFRGLNFHIKPLNNKNYLKLKHELHEFNLGPITMHIKQWSPKYTNKNS